MEIRSFLAFELPVAIKKNVDRVSKAIRHSGLDVRWVKVENLHLTIIFMGNIKFEDIESIDEAVRHVCPGYGPFDIALKGIGCFPNRRRPMFCGWAWMEISKGCPISGMISKKALNPLGSKWRKDLLGHT